jgi:hypothetical protein
MKLAIFDGNRKHMMTQQQIHKLDGEKIAYLYFTNEVYRSEVKKKVNDGEETLITHLAEIGTSTDVLLANLITKFGNDEALSFAAKISLSILLGK